MLPEANVTSADSGALRPGFVYRASLFWGRLLLLNFSLPLGLAILQRRWVMELGWAQERLTLLSENYRLGECQK